MDLGNDHQWLLGITKRDTTGQHMPPEGSVHTTCKLQCMDLTWIYNQIKCKKKSAWQWGKTEHCLDMS